MAIHHGNLARGERLLLQEFTHRVNNELTCAIQFASCEANRSADQKVKAALAAVTEQLFNYARVNRALQAPQTDEIIDCSAYLRDLSESISRSRPKDDTVRIVFVERPFFLSAERCWMLGMIVTELLTNAYRHAFDERGGSIYVDCRLEQGLVECTVSDNGAAPVAYAPGAGLRIISSLAKELDATFEFRCGQSGSHASIVFPAAHERSGRPVRSPPAEPLICDNPPLSGASFKGDS
jgi:two-component sensor histidine kinase